MTEPKKTIKAVVADDISDTLQMVCSLVEEVCPQVEIVAACTSLKTAKEAIEKYAPDLVLLDIQFSSEGKTVFDLLEEYKQSDNLFFKTIIFTGHCETEYYDMAFCYEASHFLPKPIDKNRLKAAIERIDKTKNDVELNFYVTAKDTLLINTATLNHIISLKDIVYLHYADNYTHIILANQNEIKSSRNLGHYEKILQPYPYFFRIHNDTIVNLNFIEAVSNKKESFVVLKQPFDQLKCSRERFKVLYQRIMQICD